MDIRPVPLSEVWLLRHEVMYPNYPADVVKLKDDELGIHLGIYKTGELVSVVSVFQNGREMQFRKLATRKDWQGKGLATSLLNYIDQLAQQKKVQRLWCNARLTATGLYEKMGMQAVAQSWQALGQDFIVMEKKLNQQKMEIIPAIDIIDGKCVRLSKGDYAQKTVYNENPLEVAKGFEDAGLKRLHLVDLDGAKAGEVRNWKVLEQVAGKTSLKIDFSGGISSNESLAITFNSGAAYAAIGSVAVKNEALLTDWFQAYGVEKFILGADVLDEKIQIKGWTVATDINIIDFIRNYASKGVLQFFCTDISKDGLLQGSSNDLYKKILDNVEGISLIASGGVSSIEDLEILKEVGCSGVIVGKAIYENRISLEDLKKFN
ncbi:1-(5-phosphoribosyl)-5-[(5-phosphoribosylamino)methylideneamino]imidazole-4-carboxamide isomerase [Niabella yanshanensis]|uniref:1-(5-phosphoribosyl)-5-[(5-phosphoribosylamino)methylideneamino] imidazole-4-carboxamide isomerase n=1 Tax=Niabella yanshanensis TaxID=577386 RepID=A0ABZ0W5G2_9BACT|nr:1-(5-phosphoribosyl)-5-[(5-phosphoribosylamino)methylideneamino]imidazole-4-carboxamide isomerase [Niabella yanshanensis]WQD38421.1 1-(5-phosphoribosyl)-5-[(5-phosphoribosylamino)methylideneamino]imidazole-4-carboxamide isomerase [Niabella yanshanensis]